MKTYENVIKIITGQGHDNTTTCLLDYVYFKGNSCLFMLMHLVLTQKQSNKLILLKLRSNKNTAMVIITKEVKENILDFSLSWI